jgi:hypothetical protein
MSPVAGFALICMLVLALWVTLGPVESYPDMPTSRSLIPALARQFPPPLGVQHDEYYVVTGPNVWMEQQYPMLYGSYGETVKGLLSGPSRTRSQVRIHAMWRLDGVGPFRRYTMTDGEFQEYATARASAPWMDSIPTRPYPTPNHD